jgi:hypothetical protein
MGCPVAVLPKQLPWPCELATDEDRQLAAALARALSDGRHRAIVAWQRKRETALDTWGPLAVMRVLRIVVTVITASMVHA